jgi:hypothetical protein
MRTQVEIIGGGLARVLRITATQEDALRALREFWAAQPDDAPGRPSAGAQ